MIRGARLIEAKASINGSWLAPRKTGGGSAKVGVRGFVVLAFALCVAALIAGCGSSQKTARTGSFYVALGDSLSTGIQPDVNGNQIETDRGYVDDIYNRVKPRIPDLHLVEFGCPGDSTTNLLTGQGNSTAARFYRCNRSGGSQLSAAVAFLRAHKSQVKLTTLNIGGDDIIACINETVIAKGALFARSCLEHATNTIATNLPKILTELKAAAPGAQLVDGTIYDPYLIDLNNDNAGIRALAAATLAAIAKANQEISQADAAVGIKTADVANAFSIHDTQMVKSPLLGRTVPERVALTCVYTYICAPTPRGPNIHPTTAGYGVMAKAYEHELTGPLSTQKGRSGQKPPQP